MSSRGNLGGAPAGAGTKTHYSFDDRRLEDIGRENVALLNRLAAVATRKQEVGTAPAVIKQQESSASRNRRKQAAEIERQNLLLLKKLQSTKSTVSKAQGKTGSAALARGAAPIHGVKVFAPRPNPLATARRPEWVDSTSRAGAGAGAGYSLTDPAEGEASPPRRVFRTTNLAEMALQACPDAHTLR